MQHFTVDDEDGILTTGIVGIDVLLCERPPIGHYLSLLLLSGRMKRTTRLSLVVNSVNTLCSVNTGA